MVASRRVLRDHIRFHSVNLSTTPNVNGFAIKDTSAAGTPTYVSVTEDGGSVRLLFDNTSEEQILTLYHSDKLAFDLAKLQSISWIVKVADMDAVTDLVAGVANAQNDTEDSVTVHAWFKMDGSASTTNVVVETDDGTTDNDDVATSKTLAGTMKKLTIDFTAGLSDVKFYFDGARVASGTTFDMSNITSGQNVQPFIQLHKASGTGTASVYVAACDIVYNEAYGS